jgi:hypothetical protein
MYRWLLSATLLAAAAVPALAAGHGMLGVTTQATDEDLRRGLDLTRDGLLVNQVFADGPAQRAGLRKGDVILTYNSRTVTAPEELRQLVRETEPGRNIALGIWRDGARRTLQVTLGEVPDSSDEDEAIEVPVPPSPRSPRAPSAPRAPRAPRLEEDGDGGQGETGGIHRRVIIDGKEVPEAEIDEKLGELRKQGVRIEGLQGLRGLEGLKGLAGLKELEGLRQFEGGAPMAGGHTFFMPSAGRGRLGVRVEKLNDDLAQALGASGDQGVLVVEVLEDTPAQKAGIRAGDVIVRVDSDDVDSPDELVKALAGHDGARVNLIVLRKGARREIAAELDSQSPSADREGGRSRRAERIRIMEPGQGHQVYRWNTKDGARGNSGRGDSDSEDSDIRTELRQLKQELRELREQLKDRK